MQRIAAPIAAVLVVALCVGRCTTDSGAAQVSLESESDSLAYTLGMGYADYLKSVPVDIDLQVLIRGIQDNYTDGEPLIDGEDAARVRSELGRKLQEQKRKADSKENVKESKAFFEKNAEREGVITTESGLQYEVVKEGSGPKPSADDKVRVHYRGTLLDGTEFDSSHKRGKPAEFKLNQVIKAWTEGVQLMPVGSTYKLYVPAELAYGKRGAPPKIGPNEALIFEVELLDIVE